MNPLQSLRTEVRSGARLAFFAATLPTQEDHSREITEESAYRFIDSIITRTVALVEEALPESMYPKAQTPDGKLANLGWDACRALTLKNLQALRETKEN